MVGRTNSWHSTTAELYTGMHGAPSRIRTADPFIANEGLCQLGYQDMALLIVISSGSRER